MCRVFFKDFYYWNQSIVETWLNEFDINKCDEEELSITNFLTDVYELYELDDASKRFLSNDHGELAGWDRLRWLATGSELLDKLFLISANCFDWYEINEQYNSVHLKQIKGENKDFEKEHFNHFFELNEFSNTIKLIDEILDEYLNAVHYYSKFVNGYEDFPDADILNLNTILSRTGLLPD